MHSTNRKDHLSVMLWNIWFKSQIKPIRLAQLKSNLTNHIIDHKPDVIGLHEVLTLMKTGQSEVIDLIKEHGYHVESVPFSPIRSKYLTGNIMAFRNKPANFGTHLLGPDTPAKWRGHKGYDVKLMYADIETKAGKQAHLILNYMAHLVPYNWTTHGNHFQQFKSYLDTSSHKGRTIVFGDFNQFKWMVNIWNNRFHRVSGNIKNPTWKLEGKDYLPIQANYDNVCWDKNGNIDLTDFKILGRAPSDHSPLIAKFKIS